MKKNKDPNIIDIYFDAANKKHKLFSAKFIQAIEAIQFNNEKIAFLVLVEKDGKAIPAFILHDQLPPVISIGGEL